MSPMGELLAGPSYGSEQILTAEISLAEIAKGKFDLDVVGHYAGQMYSDWKSMRLRNRC